MKDIWQIAAPDLAFLAPDIYLPEFGKVCADYAAADNPLFIPETHRNASAVPNLLYAAGRCGALCFSPFGFESMMTEALRAFAENGAPADGADADRDPGVLLSAAYAIMRNAEPALSDARRNGNAGACLRTPGAVCGTVEADGIRFDVGYVDPEKGAANGAALVFRSGGYFYVVGIGCSVCPDRRVAEIEFIEEGAFENGEWKPGRRLNGDEFSCWFGRMPGVLRLSLIPGSEQA